VPGRPVLTGLVLLQRGHDVEAGDTQQPRAHPQRHVQAAQPQAGGDVPSDLLSLLGPPPSS
jgi:hypothetical protein